MTCFSPILFEVYKTGKRKPSMDIVIGFTMKTLNTIFQTVISVWDMIHMLHVLQYRDCDTFYHIKCSIAMQVNLTSSKIWNPYAWEKTSVVGKSLSSFQILLKFRFYMRLLQRKIKVRLRDRLYRWKRKYRTKNFL